MSLEMPLGYKLHIALLALERSFTSVRAHVCLEVSSFPELLQAALEWTNKKLELGLWAFYFFDF